MNRDKPLESFIEYLKGMREPKILELGVKRSVPERSTMHKVWAPHGTWTGSDFIPGEDVDIVADVHELSSIVGAEKYDAVVSCSGFEHYKYGHLAAFEIAKSLKTGGAIYVQTHFSFIEHSFPHDYFRFTRDGLSSLFGTRNGITIKETAYQFPCKIVSEWDSQGDSNLNVTLFGVKTDSCPSTYVYDIGVK